MQPGRAAFSHMLSSSCWRINTLPPFAMSLWTLVPKESSRMRPLDTWPFAVGSCSTPSTRSSPAGPSHDASTWPTWPPAWSCSTRTGRPGSPLRPRCDVDISAAFKSAALLRFPSRRGGGCAICRQANKQHPKRLLQWPRRACAPMPIRVRVATYPFEAHPHHAASMLKGRRDASVPVLTHTRTHTYFVSLCRPVYQASAIVFLRKTPGGGLSVSDLLKLPNPAAPPTLQARLLRRDCCLRFSPTPPCGKARLGAP